MDRLTNNTRSFAVTAWLSSCREGGRCALLLQTPASASRCSMPCSKAIWSYRRNVQYEVLSLLACIVCLRLWGFGKATLLTTNTLSFLLGYHYPETSYWFSSRLEPICTTGRLPQSQSQTISVAQTAQQASICASVSILLLQLHVFRAGNASCIRI